MKKHANKKPGKTFPENLINAIRKYSKKYPEKLLVINLKTLKLIRSFQYRCNARECLKDQTDSVHAVICDPIHSHMVPAGIRAH